MKLNKLGTWAAAVATLGLALPAPVLAAPLAAMPVEAVSDIALRPGGVLLGQVVDQQGVAKANTLVTVEYAGHEVVHTTTDANGVFAAQGLRGGQYQIHTPQSTNACRLWAAETAPPAARPAALVVTGNETARGQTCNGGGPLNSWKEWVKCHPYITAGTVATAIAVPLVLADHDWDSGS